MVRGKPKTPSSRVGSMPSQVIAGRVVSGATSLSAPFQRREQSCSHRVFAVRTLQRAASQGERMLLLTAIQERAPLGDSSAA
jgi:hypothetical protein